MDELKTLLMEGAGQEKLERVLALVHHIGVKSVDEEAVEMLKKAFSHWGEQHKQKKLTPSVWLQYVELGCSLEATGELIACAPPSDFPTARTHCDKELQTTFCCGLWDAVVRPLQKQTANVPGVLNVFLHWITAAMKDYEVVFLANVAAAFRAHVAQQNDALVNALLEFAKNTTSPSRITESAAHGAVMTIVLSAVTPTRRPQTVESYLETWRAEMVEQLSRAPYPQVHSPVCIVAMSLGLSALGDGKSTDTRSGNASLLAQFALLRLVSAPLLSSRLRPCEDVTVSSYIAQVCRDLEIVVQNPSLVSSHELSLRMTEACIEDMTGFFLHSLAGCVSLVAAAQSVLPTELFRSKMLSQFQTQLDSETAKREQDLLMSESNIVALLKQFYSAAAPMLEILSKQYLVRGFLALSRLEFAREICATPAVNTSMQTVTERLEQALESSATSPDAIFSPIFRSLAMQATVASTDIPREVDVVTGCQVLSVGLVVQRKLRILLFRCTPLIDDALAIVFSGLYNIFKPVDAFAHRFLGVCLTHLGQFTPLLTVFPHYLQVTLAAYPMNASRAALTKTCGAIFGSLFYSETLAMPDAYQPDEVETAQRTVLWATRQCFKRASELLTKENKVSSNPAKPEVQAPASDTTIEKGDPHASETDALYLAGLAFELMKMAPIAVLRSCAMEAEKLLAQWRDNSTVLRELKSALFGRISQNCEAEKRAWLAAWYIEVDNCYPDTPKDAALLAQARL